MDAVAGGDECGYVVPPVVDGGAEAVHQKDRRTLALHAMVDRVASPAPRRAV